MVKGISRRVIVVRSPDPRFFEQAIFLMREDALSSPGVTAEQVVTEARQVAAGYIRRNSGLGRRFPRLTWLENLPRWAWGLSGAAATGLVWLLTLLIGG